MTPETLALIANARRPSVDDPETANVGFQNIGELMFTRARDLDTKPFLIYYELDGNRREDNYKDFFMLCGMCANMMRSFGVKRGDRIVTISHNHADTVIQYFAAWMSGICVVPVSLSEDDNRIHYIIQNSGAKLAFLRSDYADRMMPLINKIPTVSTIILCGEPAAVDSEKTVRSFDDELRNAGSIFRADEAVTADDEALLVYTSGTTGNPKGVVLTQYNLMIDAKAIASWHHITSAARMMCVLPIHHVNGTIVTLMTPMFAGGSVVLNQKFQSEHFFPRIETEMVHIVSVVPTLLAFLLEHYADKVFTKPPHFRHIICGAGPLTVELGQQFEDTFGIRIVHGYGLSETTCYSCFLPITLSDDEHQRWMREFGFPSIGAALPVNDMMIADESGNETAPSIRGEIAIRGYNVMKYYDGSEEANAKTFSYGWFRSGDEGFYETDSEGRKYFFITGRLKELIIRGGVNLSPLEIDEVINRCPGVKSGIAVGFENDFYGEEVGALVQAEAGAAITEETVIDFCREHLPFAKTPKVVVFSDTIPVTSTGKYQRNKCKPLFAEHRATQFRMKK